MILIEQFLTENPFYTAGEKIQVKGIMLHSLGYAVSKPDSLMAVWNKPDFDKACVHCFIDAANGIAYQTLPWDYKASHCGSGPNGSANSTHIGIEMCEPPFIKYINHIAFVSSNPEASRAAVTKVYNTAVDLFAMLCDKYSLDPLGENVIISHEEGHRLGIASNHADPIHLWRFLEMDYTMDTFRSAVREKMNSMKT
ncbi:MAG: N-acetylmuramoyl-L-alanine amidase [Lachnospiraceae bacterium]|nr:N-acetylmuramoyl-L-alanine amidase [Candidatus Darwinimomas equi]